MKRILLALALLPLTVLAQQVGSGEFPATSTVPTSQELNAHLSGKSLRTTYADGTPVRSKFDADGGLSVNAPNYYDAGKWKAEDGKLCGSLRKTGEFCNDARFDSGVLYLRRMNGQIVRYEP